jgi:DNA mismatch repair protein MutS2
MHKHDEAEALIVAAEMGGETPEIDLHDQMPEQAVRELDLFLHGALVRGERTIRIIHGRGTGSLRRVVHELLAKHELVVHFRDSTEPDEIGGVTYAALPKPKV